MASAPVARVSIGPYGVWDWFDEDEAADLVAGDSCGCCQGPAAAEQEMQDAGA